MWQGMRALLRPLAGLINCTQIYKTATACRWSCSPMVVFREGRLVSFNIAGRFIAAQRRARRVTTVDLAERTGQRVRVATIEAWEQGQRLASRALLSNLLWVAGALDLTVGDQGRLVGAVLAERLLNALVSLGAPVAPTDAESVLAPVVPSQARYWLARVVRDLHMDIVVDGEPALLDVAGYDLELLRERLLATSLGLLGRLSGRPAPPRSWIAARQSWQWLARSLVAAMPIGAEHRPGESFLGRYQAQRTEALRLLKTAFDLSSARGQHEARRDVALALYQGRLEDDRDGAAATLATYLATTPDDPAGADAVANLQGLARLAGDGQPGPATFDLLVALLGDVHRDGEPLAVALTLRTMWQLLIQQTPNRIPLADAADRLHRLLSRPDLANLPRAQAIQALLAEGAAVRARRYASPLPFHQAEAN